MVLPLLFAVPATPPAPTVDVPAAFSAHATGSSSWRHHTVRPGETVYDLAVRYDTSVSTLVARNRLSGNAMIYPGQKVWVPKKGGTAGKRASVRPVKPAAARRTAPTRGYTVRPGDTLSGIAARHSMSVERLRSLNGLSGSTIHPGKKLRVSGSGASATAPKRAVRGGGRHVVRPGETLSAIAAARGVSASDLARRNGISASGFIHPGQKLSVPGRKASASASRTTAKTSRPTSKRSSTGKNRPSSSPFSSNTFYGNVYSNATVRAAEQNHRTLASRAVPSRTATRAKIVATARRHGVDPKLALAISYQESGWNQRQVSVANAIGAMQVIPSSGEWASQMAGRRLDLLDADDNITAGVLILKALERGSSSRTEMIAGYYQGLASVKRNGLYADTQHYVRSVSALEKRM